MEGFAIFHLLQDRSKFSLIPPDNATGNFTKIVQRVPVLIDFDLPEGVNKANLVPGMSVVVSVRTDQKIKKYDANS